MDNELVDVVLAAAREAPARDEVMISGADPVWRTPFRIGEVGAAAIGAAGLAAARLFEQRSGIGQRVTVDVDAAAAAMRSSRYLVADPPIPPPIPGRTAFFETRDGRWMFFRGGFPHHFARQLEVLGCDGDTDSIARAVAAWDGLELEEAIAARGAIGGVVRSESDWASHEQSKAIAGLPLLEIERIGDSAPVPLPAGPRPLSDVRVLDVTRVLAGPTCARTLAEHGADVLRIGTANPPDSATFMRDTGHGKRHAELDLKNPEGAAQLQRLIATADVFSQGYRPGSLARLGFSPEEVAALRPGIVYVSESAFSHRGPWSDRRGFDSLVEAATGFDYEVRDPATGKPRQTGATPLDYTTGYLAAFAVMVALRRRAEEGGSYLVRLSLAQTARWLQSQPRVDDGALEDMPEDLAPERLTELTTTRQTPYGTLRYLAPVAQLNETPTYWERPSVPLGYDRPVWD